jgi:hypothetical protein
MCYNTGQIYLLTTLIHRFGLLRLGGGLGSRPWSLAQGRRWGWVVMVKCTRAVPGGMTRATREEGGTVYLISISIIVCFR